MFFSWRVAIAISIILFAIILTFVFMIRELIKDEPDMNICSKLKDNSNEDVSEEEVEIHNYDPTSNS